MRLNFYSHVSNADVIKTAIANIFNEDGNALTPWSLSKTGSNKGTVTASVNPLSATPADSYTFLEEFDEEFEN